MIRIATFNIGLARLRLFGLTLKDAVPHALLRLAPIARALEANADDVDIYLLQETYGRDVVDRLMTIGGFRCFTAFAAGHDFGLTVLVRDGLAAGNLRTAAFPANDWVEVVVARKGVMSVDVETPLGPFRVGNLHASYDGRGRRSIAAKAPESRRRQVEIALELLEHDADGRLLVLGGDFNASRAFEPATWGIAPARGWLDCREAADGADDDAGVTSWSPTNPLTLGRGRNEDIDLIFLRAASPPAIRTRHILTEPLVPLAGGRRVPLSDHYGFAVELSKRGHG